MVFVIAINLINIVFWINFGYIISSGNKCFYFNEYINAFLELTLYVYIRGFF